MRLIDSVWVEEKFKKALDVISAHMADSVMSEYDENIKAGQNQYSAYSTALTILKHAPTIEAVPVVHGEWIICSDGYYPYCSKCHAEPKNREMTNFCGNCGADMRKGGAE